ncbi:MAG: dienelactone hydrolase family protein [Trueperaceae bacterium]
MRRRTLRTAAWALALLAIVAVALIATVAVDRIVNAGQVRELSNDTVPGPAGPIRVHRALPGGDGPHPGVVMMHEFWGLRSEVTDKADAIAARGFHVIAPDTFRGVTVSWLPAAIANVVLSPPERIDADLSAVVDAMIHDPRIDPQRIVVMGFCYGGRAALRYALSDDRLAGTAVFYGTPVVEAERLRKLSGPLLGVFGDEDRQIPTEQVRAFEAALQDAGVPHDVRIYDGVGHAFVSDLATIRAGGAAGDAWSAFERWLGDTVGAPAK